MRHMASTVAVVALTALAAPLQAQGLPNYCEQLWIERNLIFARAGYCFGSTLGSDLFGNAGCTTQNPALSAADREAVGQIRETESRAGCSVATGRGASGVMRAYLGRRNVFVDIPAADELGWGCLGYTGPSFTLHAGTDSRHAVTGQIQPGLFVYSEYYPRNGWAFLSASMSPGGPTVAEGWSNARIGSGQCLQEAG